MSEKLSIHDQEIMTDKIAGIAVVKQYFAGFVS